MSEARYLVGGDVFDRMAEIPDGSIDLIVTSPPFLALRSYLPADHPDKAKEIGSEATPADFLTTLLALTQEWRRVLAPHGSLCVELGDTYSGSGGAGGDYNADGLRDGQPKFKQNAAGGSASYSVPAAGTAQTPNPAPSHGRRNRPADVAAGILAPTNRPGPEGRDKMAGWPLDKSLCLLPTLYPASLAYGRNLLTGQPCEPWRIRNQIVWHRPNPPVGALGDKVRPSTSYITVACTSRTRWFDLDSERGAPSANTHARTAQGVTSRPNDCKTSPDGNRASLDILAETAGAPPLDCWQDTTTADVWTLPTQPYKGSHYATFPITLPRKLINLMCPRQVCTTCGEPRRRITGEPTYERNGEPLTPPKWTPGIRMTKQDGATTRVAETLGWSDCGHNTWRRGIVLDPFAGSGTTLVAASELGRDSIGIDVDDDQALRILLVDNRSSDLGDYQEQSLTDLLASLPDLIGTGYEPGDLDARLATLDSAPIDGWDDRDARSILLSYPVEQHAHICDRLDSLGEQLGAATYSETVVALITKELGPQWT